MQKHAVHGGGFYRAVGERLDHLERRADIVNADVLDAWYDPSPRVVLALRDHLTWLVKTSPPTHAEGLIEVVAGARGIPASQVLLGSGSSSLIFLLFPRLFSGGCVGVLDPMYGEYEHVLGRAGAKVCRFELDPPSFRPDPVALAEFAAGLDGLVLVNPNSPTGVGLRLPEVEALLVALPAHVRVWIDETYIDHLPGAQTAEGLVSRFPNLVVAKSMSKYYALSGLRVGYCVARPGLVEEASADSPPWSVGLLAQVAAAEALRDPAYYEEKAVETRELRHMLTEGLIELGMVPTASEANFVMAHVPGGGVAAAVAKAEKQGVFVRNCDSLSPRFKDDTIRVAVKDAASQARVLAALRSSGL